MNDYLAHKEGEYSYSSRSNKNIFVDDNLCKNHTNEIQVTLTPDGYLDSFSQSERHLMLFKSETTKVYLTIIHEKSNLYDNQALKIYYNNVHIGYIQKRFDNLDRTTLIENFCFSNNHLNEISIICVNKKYIIYKENRSKKILKTSIDIENEIDLAVINEEFQEAFNSSHEETLFNETEITKDNLKSKGKTEVSMHKREKANKILEKAIGSLIENTGWKIKK